MNQSKTQLAHLIKIGCDSCSGRGWHPVKNKKIAQYAVSHDDCPNCTNGMIEYIIGLPLQAGLLKTRMAMRPLPMKDLVEIYSHFQPGSTVKTTEGERIAGEIELKQGEEIGESILYDAGFVIGDLDTTYFCIARSYPVKVIND